MWGIGLAFTFLFLFSSFLHTEIQLWKSPLLNGCWTECSLRWIAFASPSQSVWPDLFMSLFLNCLLCHWSVYLFFCQYHTVPFYSKTVVCSFQPWPHCSGLPFCSTCLSFCFLSIWTHRLLFYCCHLSFCLSSRFGLGETEPIILWTFSYLLA